MVGILGPQLYHTSCVVVDQLLSLCPSSCRYRRDHSITCHRAMKTQRVHCTKLVKAWPPECCHSYYYPYSLVALGSLPHQPALGQFLHMSYSAVNMAYKLVPCL